MIVSICQIYAQVGVNYPFSTEFQRWVSKEITKRIAPSVEFIESYSDRYDLIFNLSAKAELDDIEIVGPSEYKKREEIEFTIFLPFNHIGLDERKEYRDPLNIFFYGVVLSLEKIFIDASAVKKDSADLVDNIIQNDSMSKIRL